MHCSYRYLINLCERLRTVEYRSTWRDLAPRRNEGAIMTNPQDWVACDACEKWRRVPSNVMGSIKEDDKWCDDDNETLCGREV